MVQVVLSLRTGGTASVSTDNAARAEYNLQLGTYNLNTFKSSGTAASRWRNGVEIVATVTPSSYAGLIVLERERIANKSFNALNQETGSGGPAPDTSDQALRDDDPQSGSSGGKVYDLDAPGISLTGAPVGSILRTRVNFKQWARSAQGYRLSPDFAWNHRLSIKQTASGDVLETSVANDNKAATGAINLTWNLQ